MFKNNSRRCKLSFAVRLEVLSYICVPTSIIHISSNVGMKMNFSTCGLINCSIYLDDIHT